MNALIQAGEVERARSTVFAHNLLAVIVPTSNPGQITHLQDLAKPGLKLVLAAASVPAGQDAVDFLDKASDDPNFGSHYKANVLKNVVAYASDEETVVNKVAQSEADAGLVYTTDVTDALGNTSQFGLKLAIPATLQTEATYPIAPLNPRDAQRDQRKY